ncbi:MAG TPA: multicopper oxidase domain-containing protein [Candidatus Limnocylindria bacterium]|nr:multicopper oxidase domain-containing protein [Candidatus Limnocylindria bacterium]
MQRTFAYFAAFTGMGTVFIAAILVASIALGGYGAPGSKPSASTVASGPIGTIEVHAFDLGFDPAMPTVAQPGIYTVKFVNDGGTTHDMTFGDGTRISAESHATATGTVTVPAAGMNFHCAVPGHADAGMTGMVMVESGAAGASASPSASLTPEQMAAEDAAVTKSFPAKTAGKGAVVLAPKILADGTKQFELTASVIQWEVSPGKKVTAWAYNGMVPGPTIRVKLGDRVKVLFHNQLPAPTTIHFHGLTLPNDMDGVPVINQPAVMPGQSFTYAFTVKNTGSNMYHSHFMAQSQVPMGLLGAFIVDDPTAPRADVDYPMILNDGPLGFTINGKSFPATEPIVVKKGQKLLVRYMNEGLQIHPMHLHGMPQEVVALDGHVLPVPYLQDTVMVAPGQRVDVLVDATEVGTWAFHCHILTHAEGDHGMFGMVTALVVQ